MKTIAFVVAACALLTGCGKTALEESYDKALTEAKSDCATKNGDEFKPYGANAWLSVLSMSAKPMAFRCQRLSVHWKRGVAVYIMHVRNNIVTVEIRQ